MTELIVRPSLICIRKHGIGFVTFLELRLCLLISRVQVRVVLLGHLTVSLFQFIV